jgi:hypothetical protein
MKSIALLYQSFEPEFTGFVIQHFANGNNLSTTTKIQHRRINFVAANMMQILRSG